MWIYQGGMRAGNPRFKCGYCGGIVTENGTGRVCPHCRRVEYGDDEGDLDPLRKEEPT